MPRLRSARLIRREVPVEQDEGRPLTPKPSLLWLPMEITASIAEECDSATQVSLARACTSFREIALNALHKKILIKDNLGMDLFTRLIGSNQRMSRIRRTQSFEAYLYWYGPDRAESKAISIIDKMGELRHLRLTYTNDDDKWNVGHTLMYLPAKLPLTLRSCSLNFTNMENWPISCAEMAFQHPTLNRLDFTGAATKDGHAFSQPGNRSTALKDLNLFDCDITPEDLGRILEYPRALEHLAICSHYSSFGGPDNQQHVDYGVYFNAIRGSAAGESLKGLRFDMKYRGRVVVPAPGLHEFSGIRYLEISEDHLEAPPLFSQEFSNPEIDCPLDSLLPPEVEVLKITPFASESTVLWRIVNNKLDDFLYLPRLRKIILVYHYRTQQMSDELKRVYTNQSLITTRGVWKKAKDGFPVTTSVPNIESLQTAFKKVGVDVIQLLEDSMRKEVMKEGAGPALWEISEQAEDVSLAMEILPEEQYGGTT